MKISVHINNDNDSLESPTHHGDLVLIVGSIYNKMRLIYLKFNGLVLRNTFSWLVWRYELHKLKEVGIHLLIITFIPRNTLRKELLLQSITCHLRVRNILGLESFRPFWRLWLFWRTSHITSQWSHITLVVACHQTENTSGLISYTPTSLCLYIIFDMPRLSLHLKKMGLKLYIILVKLCSRLEAKNHRFWNILSRQQIF